LASVLILPAFVDSFAAGPGLSLRSPFSLFIFMILSHFGCYLLIPLLTHPHTLIQAIPPHCHTTPPHDATPSPISDVLYLCIWYTYMLALLLRLCYPHPFARTICIAFITYTVHSRRLLRSGHLFVIAWAQCMYPCAIDEI